MFKKMSRHFNSRPLLVIIALTLSALSAEAGAGQARNATGALKVETGKPDSVVFINNIRHGSANSEGVLELARVKAGTYPVRIRTVGFADWRGTVTIVAGASRQLRVTQQPVTDQALIHYQKGDYLRDRGKGEEAVKEYQQALALRPAFSEARVALTRILMGQHEFQEAEKQLAAAMKQHKGPYVEAQVVLANLRRSQGLIEESIAEYRKAIRMARGVSAEAHVGLAIALNEAGRVDEAIKEYRIGIAQDMDTEPVLYFQLGEILENAGRNEEAIEAYRSYLRLDPEGQYASAIESIIERLKQEPDDDR